MSVLIIDGYNVLGKSNEQERDQLMQQLAEFQKSKPFDIIVYFDGTHGGTRFGDEMIIENVRVIFTPLHETADDHMITYMEENTHKEIIVVSSDRKIQKAATRNLFTYFSSEEFLQNLQAKTTDGQGYNMEEDSPYRKKIHTKKKGNPRKKSKKQRQKEQKLKKLS